MKEKRVLIVHPSRGRPAEAEKAFFNHVNLRKNLGTKIKYIFCLDFDDPRLPEYNTSLYAENVEVAFMVNENVGCVQAANRAYNRKLLDTVDLVILTSDDMRLCYAWDFELFSVLDLHGNCIAIKTTQPGAVDND